MKLLLFILMLPLLSPIPNKEIIITPGKGINDIEIGKSKKGSVIKEFGSNYRESEVIACGLDESIFYYTLSYSECLKFYYSSKTKKKISEISLSAPIQAKTTEGIILGKSSRNDILKIYGNPDFNEGKSFVNESNVKFEKLQYKEKGITFYLNSYSVMKIEVYKSHLEKE